ncbi:hypothetical protein [Streptomyces hoynatensis]|uniref:Uncharacterized protein n=1 Tax=Streptomyces hoynatensis TaxID=1141874 RepID=A0A3A9Z7D7_9ACTN|nr:hypothetical protein [Streptomyces hoynatensis]RKN43949.1 hypothetical protein D7294_09695 [Streptomyces hoynatensis]
MSAAAGERRRAAAHGLLRAALGRGAGRLTILFAPHRPAEAAWLSAYARAYGLPSRVRALGPARPWAVERAARAAAEPGTAVLVLHDATLRLPEGATQLAGTEELSPLDLWQPEEDTAAEVAGLIAGLRPELLVRGGGHELRCATAPAAPTSPAGAAEAPLAHAEGVFLADGALAVNRPTAWDARLAGRPVAVTVEAGRATAVECPDPVLRHFLRRAVHTHLAHAASALRFGARRLGGGYSAAPGPVNEVRRGVALRLTVPRGQAPGEAAADLCIDLISASGEWS